MEFGQVNFGWQLVNLGLLIFIFAIPLVALVCIYWLVKKFRRIDDNLKGIDGRLEVLSEQVNQLQKKN